MNRRRWLAHGCAVCAGWQVLAPAAAQPGARPEPAGADDIAPLPAWARPPRLQRPGPEGDEGGLWALLERHETRVRRSPLRLRDAALESWLGGIAARLAGDHAADLRVYPLRVPHFNASMAPNGMMQLWSGLLLRVENEAQLAAVLGHEIGHYLQRHSLQRLRDARSRTAFGHLFGLFGLAGAVGQVATLAGAYAFSREQEREADRIGLQLMRDAGWDPGEAATVWTHLIEEMAVAQAGQAAPNPLLATHPAPPERRRALARWAGSTTGELGEARLQAVLAPLRGMLLDDELRRGRPDETLALTNRLLLRAPHDALLLHARGEAHRQRGRADDAERALEDFLAALGIGGEPAQTHRSLGLLLQARGEAGPARAALARYLELAPDAPDAAMVARAIGDLQP
jgi:predicted Zn-dependent protease